MARIRNPENRNAILQAAVHEIALAGLAAPTAKIAQRAGIASGTLFTYFASKEELLNELYYELKLEVYARVNAAFPHKADLKTRSRHVWSTTIEWAIEFPEKRRASVQLNLSGLVTPATRERTAADRANIDRTLTDLGKRPALSDLPKGFAAATMSAMQEATMDFITRQPRQRKALIERSFEVFWRAVS
jgi:AcrR family transcriptional regulator